MPVSIIVPLLNEAATLPELLQHLEGYAAQAEIICVDGGSDDGTVALLKGCPFVRYLESPVGRARQMNAGARMATDDILLFLHADTRLPPGALGVIAHALENPDMAAGRFDVRFDHTGFRYRLTAWLMNLRSRLTGIATGDQAIFVRRSVFNRLARYPETPLMEDVAFCRRLRAQGCRMAYLPQTVTTSTRRWERHGFWRTVFLMWTLRLLNYLGVPPERLAAWYGPAR